MTGFVPALERLAVRQISARFLSQDERIEIADLRSAGLGIRQIADQLGRAPSTVSRELRRNASAAGYRPFEAHRRATAQAGPRATGGGSRPASSCGSWSWSSWPSGGARSRSAASCGCGSRPARDVAVSREHLPGHLPAGISAAAGRRRWHRTTGPRCAPDVITAVLISAAAAPATRFEQPMRTISQRPFPPEDRSRPGIGRAI